MRKAMIKKFIAAVLAFAMLAGALPVFAAPATPTPLPVPVRNPNQDISLYVHHTIGTLGQPVPNPGEWLPGNPPTITENRDPATGTIWRAARILPPAHFEHLTYDDPMDPPSVQGAARIPQAVSDAIIAGQLGGIQPSPLPARRPVTGHAGWYVTSSGSAPAVANAGSAPAGVASGVAIDGVLQAITGSNGLVTPAERDRIALFTPAEMRVSSDDAGHGLWLVWEVYNTVADPLPQINGRDQVRTPDYGIIPPFLVNMPHFRHFPGDGPDPAPAPDQPGQWLYRVHVFPKQPADSEEGKGIVDINIGVGGAPGLVGNSIATEYAIIDWAIYLEISEDIQMLAAVPNSRLNEFGAPGAPHASPMPAPPATVAPWTARPHILVQDTLDHRLRLLPATYDWQHNAPTGPLTGLAPNSHTLANPLVPAVGGSWFSLYTVARNDAGVVVGAPVPFPRGAAGAATTNWEVILAETAAAAMLPYPNQTTPAGARGQQTFWLNITQVGRDALHAARPATLPSGATSWGVEIRFRTVMNDLTEVHSGAIYNEAYINFGNRPTSTTGGPDDTDTRTVIRDLDVFKTNPNDQALDGAVFFLFRDDQMSGTSADAIRTPLAGEVPTRIAISGGRTGTWINSQRTETINATTPPVDFVASNGATHATPAGAEQTFRHNQWAVVYANLAISTLHESGIARFVNLVDSLPTPPATNWYLFEALAPHGGYNRVVGFERVIFPALICTFTHPGSETCLSNPGDCVYSNVTHSFRFTNTRDFTLPMTGGAGTIMFTAAGVSLMGIAGLFLFLARKKDKAKVVRTIQ
ncbi:MAG: LPXTG cell wall anchor domain-containing protein [Defluviitaleaceae bacterium]|nr:LPXTG cell wall anchor domain-containing protein [Defluviitaleaceae bacterium]